MKKSIKKSNNKNFLQEIRTEGVSKKHHKYLGTTVPEGYFSKSKNAILDAVKATAKKEISMEPKKQMVFWLRPQFRYMAAASIVFILSVTVWLQSSNYNEVEKSMLEYASFSEDILINSLLIDDAEMDLFADNILIDEIIIKASIAEQKSDDLFLNYLFLEDSLTDNYSDDQFLEIIIL
jgi:hypothetical protein